MTRPIFALIALAAIGAAFARPAPAGDDAGRLIAAAQKNGLTPIGRETQSNALSIFRFSAPGCAEIEILPVSALLQETALLKRIGGPGDGRTLIYLKERWPLAEARPAALRLVAQQILQIGRLSPQPRIGTMLYLVAAEGCAAPMRADWSGFWDDI
jgi:hypothetical protein